ncbi:DUF3426 domain-containing protein [Noviherbaspirillum pedocola]|uniref:Zinc-ribbon domain-containing protein n=1 Tax=Noviherbaspirillum pedocola TaxID=2801341 RepID=A0A934W438_9BURK|nr:DUF3426 domain-containing protein [Noviherbaspirillum pedocola]MBK4733482.1 zinc-ribbon domain-containing protein [Noviherbaspirillum pedocola]
MVLATRCPHCRTTFRVVQDQLKLRGGLVRCGACKEIFNGVENLLRPTQPPQERAEKPVEPESAQHQPGANGAAGDDMATRNAPQSDNTDKAVAPPDAGPDTAQPPSEDAASAATVPAPSSIPTEPVAGQPPDPLLRMTLMDFSHAYEDQPGDESENRHEDQPTNQANVQAESVSAPASISMPGPVPTTIMTAPHPMQADFALPRMPAQRAPMPSANDDELGRAIDELKRKPWRGTQAKPARPDEDAIDALDSNEPQFIAHATRRERRDRTTNIALGAGSAVLALLLLFQALYTWRVELASTLPGAAPLLKRGCALFGCHIGLPARIDQVTIESSELQALPNATDTFALIALLRNRASVAQQWPNLELTLNDVDEHAIARRVFTPRDYLPAGQDPEQGFAPTSEQSLKLVFSLSQLKASGYRVYLFYP